MLEHGVDTADIEARRLMWRCRRGMKELDLLLERFARGELAVADPGRRRNLARLLELPDPVLVDYLLGQGLPPEPELAELVLRIRTSPPLTPSELAGRTVGPDGPPPAHVAGS